ncbi:hypothetical protein LA324_05390 [Corynebacterium coyleae]|uniref:VG15 protein n=1 Tax=Corynebacterium coyleae TaxID=53374 RepID=UPI001CCA7181|nr:hypothetical protein [Corynebacterium coyleae]UBI10043.1 hypothetical protein LA324_05390 [Corynebacterium coyleae]
MDLTTLDRRTIATINPAMAYSQEFLSNLIGKPITRSLWQQIIDFLFGIARPASEQVAYNARAFYDVERARVFPEAPRHDILLSVLSYEIFARDMNDIRGVAIGAEITQEVIHRINLRMARSIENSGRWTIMNAIQTPDPWLEEYDEFSWIPDEDQGEFTSSTISKEELKKLRKDLKRRGRGIQGWARVPTGRETCAFCLALCSRGAVYRDARRAGSKMSDDETLKVQRSGLFDPEEHMTQWHDGCDCKVVPVWDLDDWQGKQRADAAYRMWSTATKNTQGKESMREFRRRLESGDLDINDFM